VEIPAESTVCPDEAADPWQAGDMASLNAAAVDRLLGFNDFTPPPPTGPLFDVAGKARNQWPVIVILAVAAGVTVSPLGVSGRGLYGLALLVVNIAFATVRMVSPDRLGPRHRFVILCAAALFGGLLIGFDPSSTAAIFACYVAGHAGYSLPTRAAAVVAVCCSGFSAAAVALDHGTGYLWAWHLLVGLTVLLGMTRQNRQQLLRLADEKVLETRRAAAAEARASALAERGRIARDLHDVLAHSLSGVNMQLNLAGALLDSGRTDQARAAVDQARQMVTDGLADARSAVYALREETLELVPAIRALLQFDHEQLDASTESVALDARRTATILRIVTEAVTNARRHAPGAPTTVTVGQIGAALSITVHNEPPATPAAPSPGSGMGMVGMRERAAELGARLTAGADPDGSWTVSLEVPTDAGQERQEP